MISISDNQSFLTQNQSPLADWKARSQSLIYLLKILPDSDLERIKSK